MGAYRITPFRPALIGDIAEVASRVRGRKAAFERAYFEWKYLDNPYLVEPLLHVALDGSRVVGLRAFYGTSWRQGSDGQAYTLPAAADLMILDEHRQSDLYRRLNDAALADAADRGYTHVLNLSASPENALTAIVSLGWKGVVRHDAVTNAPPDALEHRPPASGLQAWAKRVTTRVRRLVAPTNAFRRLDRAAQRGVLSERGIRVTSSPVEVAEFASRPDSTPGLQLVRDETFLRWRFGSPAASYASLLAEDGADWGYLVIAVVPGKSTAFVLDWRATTDELRARLLDTALAHAPAPFSIWTSGLSHSAAAHLKARGFTREDGGRSERWRWSLLVRATSAEGERELNGVDPLAASSWDVTALASDAY